MHCFNPDVPLNFTMCSSMLFLLSFDSTSDSFKFRWSITSLILKPWSVLSSFLLSAKCRFWRISQKHFRIIAVWIPSLPIKFFTLRYSTIVVNLLMAITKFIPRSAFRSSLLTVKFLPFWIFFHSKGLIVNNTISLSRHEQVCLSGLHFKRYFSYHRAT